MKAGPSQVNFAETNPSKYGVCSSRTMQGSFSQALRTARRCGCDLRIDFLHLSQSGGRLIKFKNLNLHATLYHAVNVGERHFRQTFCPTSRSRERPCRSRSQAPPELGTRNGLARSACNDQILETMKVE